MKNIILTKETIEEYFEEKKKVRRITFIFGILLSLYYLNSTLATQNTTIAQYVILNISAIILLNTSVSIFSYFNWRNIIYTQLYQIIAIVFLCTVIYLGYHSGFFIISEENHYADVIPKTLIYALGCIFGLTFIFKIIHKNIFLRNNLYYPTNDDLLNSIENLKETKTAKVKFKETSRYSVMSETELNIALKNAIADEDYETAKIIKEELEKYR